MKIGIIGAMPQEIRSIVPMIAKPELRKIGQREFTTGKIEGMEVVIAYSRCGKVAAGATVSSLILGFGVTHVIFTGVAGAIQPKLQIGDIVVGQRLVQHDMNGSPLFPRFEVPLLEKAFFETDSNLSQFAFESAKDFWSTDHAFKYLDALGTQSHEVLRGDIASGDQFFNQEEAKDGLLKELPSILCVEMEGAAVAQVCYEFGVPFAVIRTISDTADHNAEVDFWRFVDEVETELASEVVRGILRRIGDHR